MNVLSGIVITACISVSSFAGTPPVVPASCLIKNQQEPEKKKPGVTLTEEDFAAARHTIIGGKAVKKVWPKYPKEARKAKVVGPVEVEVLVDEKGRVIKAVAVSGDPLLHEASQKAALKWRFEPARIYGARVKASGKITFNFTLP